MQLLGCLDNLNPSSGFSFYQFLWHHPIHNNSAYFAPWINQKRGNALRLTLELCRGTSTSFTKHQNDILKLTDLYLVNLVVSVFVSVALPQIEERMELCNVSYLFSCTISYAYFLRYIRYLVCTFENFNLLTFTRYIL